MKYLLIILLLVGCVNKPTQNSERHPDNRYSDISIYTIGNHEYIGRINSTFMYGDWATHYPDCKFCKLK